MMTHAQFKDCLISLFDSEKLDRFPEEWGFTARGSGSVSKIGYCTNLTPHTVEEAIRHGADFVLTHHDAWSFMYGMPEACESRLEAHGIGNSFFHLPLDDADFGTNAALAGKLGLCNIERSTLSEDLFYCGRIGEWEHEKSLDDAKAMLENAVGEQVHAWRNHDRPIRKVCIVAGGGAMTDYIKEAVDRSCDAYITGEKTLYSVEFAQFAGIDLLVGSHTATEFPGIESFARRVEEKLPNVRLVRLHEERVE